MAFQKKNAKPAGADATEEAAEEMPMMAPPPKKKAKGKMPPPGASKPAWRKIADQMAKK
jgi:hypothetical protein